MNRLVLFMGGLVLIVSLILGVNNLSGYEAGSDMKEVESEVIIRFISPVSSQELVNLVKEFSVQPKEIYYETNGISGGYTVSPDESIETALRSMLKEHKIFLKYALRTNSQKLSKGNEEETLGLQELNHGFKKILHDVGKGNLKLSGIRVPNDFVVVPLLMENDIVQSIESLPGARGEKKPGFSESEEIISPNSYYHEPWAPYTGTSDVSQWQTYQTFYFNNTWGFHDTSTYEHETQVYDRNFADYGGYWSSNLPRAYYDTPFADKMDNFTVGSSQASSIREYTRYYTYMGLRPGSVFSAFVIIKGQKGVRLISWCYSTWCIKATETTDPGMARFNAPAGLSWLY